MEFNDRKTKKLDLTVNDRPVSARTLPLRVAMKLYRAGDDIPVEDMADVVIACLVYTDDGARVFSDDDLEKVLDADADFVAQAFQGIADFAAESTKDAKKK